MRPSETLQGGRPDTDLRACIPYALAATFAVVVVPALAIFGLLAALEPDPSILVSSALSMGVAAAATSLGTKLWMKQERSSVLSFGDLMIWSWIGHKRADERLARASRQLGIDRGMTVLKTGLSQAEQLKILRQVNDALEQKDPYTRGHSRRVERHVYRTAVAMGLSLGDITDLRLAAGLHDVGKINVPDHILKKPGKLTDEERCEINRHSAWGAAMIAHVGNAGVVAAVRSHHERWDGKGYPDGLAGTDIPLFARIIGVCDTFDAITSNRAYRKKSDRNKAIQILKDGAGTQFDPKAVDAFLAGLPARNPLALVTLLLPSGIRELVTRIGALFTSQGISAVAAGSTAATVAVLSAATVTPFTGTKTLPDRPPVRAVAGVANPLASDVVLASHAASAARPGDARKVAGKAHERASVADGERGRSRPAARRSAGTSTRRTSKDGSTRDRTHRGSTTATANLPRSKRDADGGASPADGATSPEQPAGSSGSGSGSAPAAGGSTGATTGDSPAPDGNASPGPSAPANAEGGGVSDSNPAFSGQVPDGPPTTTPGSDNGGGKGSKK